MAVGSTDLRYQAILEQWLESRDWKDELEVDAENHSVRLVTGINIAGQSGRLIVEGSDATDLVDVYLYVDVKCKDTRRSELCVLFNEINLKNAYGRFEVFPDGYMRWRHRVDFEGSQPSGKSIEQIVGPAWNIMERYLDPILAVALTNTAATEAMDEWERAQEERTQEDDAPTEL